MLAIDKIAPDFTLCNQNNEKVTLSQYKGKRIVLYFYPKDKTPGCTAQACGYSQLYQEFAKQNTIVIGISKDSVSSHLKFQEAYKIPFQLLADPNLEVIQQYDVLKEKMMFGKKVMGTVRSTYIIDENQKIVAAFEKVKATENPENMLAWIKENLK